MIGRLQIGPVQFQVEAVSRKNVFYSDPAYKGFWLSGDQDDLNDSLVSARVEVSLRACEIPLGAPLYASGKNWAMWEEGRDLIFCSGFYE